MGRKKGDEKYWNEVTSFEENGKQKWKCKHCEKTYGGGYSRIKLHLDKEQKGQGITKCAVYCSNEEDHNIIASTSIHPQETVNALNPLQVVEDAVAHEMIDTIGASINHQTNIESTCLFGGWAAEHGMDESNNLNDTLITFQRKISVLNDLVSDLTREEDTIKEQLQWLESRGKKRKRQVDYWMDELRDLKKRVVDLDRLGSIDFFAPDTSYSVDEFRLQEIDQLIGKMQRHKDQKPPVLSNEFVGEEFGENVKKMWKLLGDDQVFVIGIHGMGGVGKTFLATYMENEIKRKGTFRHVFWVTVTPDFTIFKLQNQIAKKIGVKLDEDDERSQATILSLELEKIEKSLLILDDVWKFIDLQKVGIPLKVNGIKLIITSRLKHVSRQMDCLQGNTIEVKHLYDDDEDWELFLLKLGHHGTPATLPPQVLEIARSVVRGCGGLPLAINVMARTMKGCYDTFMWRHELNKLQNFEMGEEVKEEVFPVLKRSYDNLMEKDMQKYLLYFALLPLVSTHNYESASVIGGRKYCVSKLVEGGLLSVKRSLREIFVEGHVIVNKLIDHSLLDKIDDDELQEIDGLDDDELREMHGLDDDELREMHGLDDDELLKMHGLVRNMACHILKQSHNYMVKCNEKLSKIPDMNEWTVDLEVVSLGGKKIKEISKDISPNCPRLATLILSSNLIRHISEGFFVLMNALTVLDLSNNRELTYLPHSLSNLRSLVSLALQNCSKLECIPPLGELQALSRLDISRCAIREVPNGLENLINLKWLDLSMNARLMSAPGCVLSSLTNMQYLDLRYSSLITVQEVQGMGMLEYFGGRFIDQDNYNRYAKEILDRGYGPEFYHIHVGGFSRSTSEYNYPMNSYLIGQSVWFKDCEELLYILPRDTKKLIVTDNNQWVCLCATLSPWFPSSLNSINIESCKKLKMLFCLSRFCSLCTNIQNLEFLRICDLKSLTGICKEDVLIPSLSPTGLFSNLKKFDFGECHEIETLFTPGLVPQLRNLEFISIWSCDSMKAIFAVSNLRDDDNFNIILPKLTSLKLTNLPQLKIVCRGILVCGSEHILSYDTCPNLERLPIIRRV